MIENKINCAVIGCGHIGKRHAEMIMRNSRTHLVALCDVQPKENLNISNFPGNFHSDIQQLLSEESNIDVVHICTPNGLHATHANLALLAGKHVVIEKPMALTVADCDSIIANAAIHNKSIFCVMQNRFSPPSVWLKNMITENRLGKIYMVQVNCFWNRDERYYHKNTWHGKNDLDGGTLFTQFSDFIDTMVWLFGDIANIQTQFADVNHQSLTDFEDSGNITFSFKNGGIGSVHYSSAVYQQNFESSIRIIGEKGTIAIGGQYMNEVKYCHVENYTMPELKPTAAPNNYGPYIGSAANHHFIIDNIVDVLDNNGAIATTAEEGKLVVSVIERIYAQRPDYLLKNK